jgi:tRNA dimethylallyltransferase
VAEKNTRLLFLIGPTASGKSDLSIYLAKKLNAEIISADSMQIYRGMNIGTATPSSEEQAGIPHHMINCIPPSQEHSVFDYQLDVHTLLEKEGNQGKEFVVSGGTGLYVKTLLEGISPKPERNQETREALEERVQKEGLETLHKELTKIDPEYAGKVSDARRVVRALEVYQLSGRTVSDWNASNEGGLIDAGYPIKIYGLRWERESLRKRVRQRVQKMFSLGLLEEVRELMKEVWAPPARAAIGYRECVDHLEGKVSKEELEDLIVKNTMAFAKRQMTWFRKTEGVHWFDLSEDSQIELLGDEICGLWSEGCR